MNKNKKLALLGSSLGPVIPPRVLIASDSILNSSFIASRIQTESPAAAIARYTYGGSRSPMGLVPLSASGISVYGTTGNLLSHTNLSNWQGITASIADATSPITGASVKKLTGTGVAGQRIQTNVAPNGDAVVPAGAPQMTFCITLEPGTLSATRLLVYNRTTSGTIRLRDWSVTASAKTGSGPVPLSITVSSTDGVGYVAGNVIFLQVYIGASGGTVAGYLYASNPLLVAGPAVVFSATSGTPELPSAAGWKNPYSTEHDQFELAVIEWGRNDYAVYTTDEFNIALRAQLEQAASYAQRVLLCSPPPLALADLTDWDSADTFVSGGFLFAMQTAAASGGADVYDAWNGFKSAGSPVNTLMRDTTHPTDASATSLGMGQYVNAIVAALRRGRRKPQAQGSLASQVFIGAEPVSGTWVWTEFTATNEYDAHGLIAGHMDGITRALTSSTVGAQVQWTNVTGTFIGIVVVMASSAGSINVVVDALPAVAISCQDATVTNYPRGTTVRQSLATSGPHTVTAEVTAGQARIVGLVAF